MWLQIKSPGIWSWSFLSIVWLLLKSYMTRLFPYLYYEIRCNYFTSTTSSMLHFYEKLNRLNKIKSLHAIDIRIWCIPCGYPLGWLYCTLKKSSNCFDRLKKLCMKWGNLSIEICLWDTKHFLHPFCCLFYFEQVVFNIQFSLSISSYHCYNFLMNNSRAI